MVQILSITLSLCQSTCIENGEHWIRVSEAYDPNFKPISYLLLNKLSENPFAVDTMAKLSGLFDDENIINVYEIKNTDLDRVLNILVRTNGGGKPFGKGDFL